MPNVNIYIPEEEYREMQKIRERKEITKLEALKEVIQHGD